MKKTKQTKQKHSNQKSTINLFTEYMILHGKTLKIPQELLQIINSANLQDTKINIQQSVVFLYSNELHRKKKQFHLL